MTDLVVAFGRVGCINVFINVIIVIVHQCHHRRHHNHHLLHRYLLIALILINFQNYNQNVILDILDNENVSV